MKNITKTLSNHLKSIATKSVKSIYTTIKNSIELRNTSRLHSEEMYRENREISKLKRIARDQEIVCMYYPQPVCLDFRKSRRY